ncbi:MAG: hypothetical protein ACOYOV_00230 [Bacteroidales bacterium]
MAKYIDFGEILEKKAKDGEAKGELYIKITKDITLKAGTFVNLNDPKEKYQRMLNSGKLDEKGIDDVTAKLSDYAKGGKLSFVKKSLNVKIDE